eukprot:497077-Pleurochrysis_carterae.AAC.2
MQSKARAPSAASAMATSSPLSSAPSAGIQLRTSGGASASVASAASAPALPALPPLPPLPDLAGLPPLALPSLSSL